MRDTPPHAQAQPDGGPSAPRDGQEVDPASALGPDASFEELLERLEAIVERLEGGELRLEDALAQFEEGMRLSGQAGKILEAAQLKVTQLIEARDGTLDEAPLDVS